MTKKSNIFKILMLISLSVFVSIIFLSCGKKSVVSDLEKIQKTNALAVKVISLDDENSTDSWYFTLNDGDEDFDRDGNKESEYACLHSKVNKKDSGYFRNDYFVTVRINRKAEKENKMDIFGLKKKLSINPKYYFFTREIPYFLNDKEKNEENSKDFKNIKVKNLDKIEYDNRIKQAKDKLNFFKAEFKKFELNKNNKFEYNKETKTYISEDGNYSVKKIRGGLELTDKYNKVKYQVTSIGNQRLTSYDEDQIKKIEDAKKDE